MFNDFVHEKAPTLAVNTSKCYEKSGWVLCRSYPARIRRVKIDDGSRGTSSNGDKWSAGIVFILQFGRLLSMRRNDMKNAINFCCVVNLPAGKRYIGTCSVMGSKMSRVRAWNRGSVQSLYSCTV